MSRIGYGGGGRDRGLPQGATRGAARRRSGLGFGLLLAAAAGSGSALQLEALVAHGNRGADLGTALAAGADGGALFGSRFSGRLPTPPLADPLHAAGDGDVALLGSDAAFATHWARRFGGVRHDELRALARSGDVLLAGGFFVEAAALHQPGRTTAPLQSQGGADGFVAALDAASGTLRWQQRIGGKQADLVRTLTVLDDGEVLAGGHFQGAARLSDDAHGVHFGRGGSDVYLQRLDPASGAVRWARSHGSGGDDELAAAVALPDGGALLLLRTPAPLLAEPGPGGSERNAASAPCQPADAEPPARDPADSADALLLWLDADGHCRLARTLASSGPDLFNLLARRSDGRIVLAGSFVGHARWTLPLPPPARPDPLALVAAQHTLDLHSRGSSDLLLLELDAEGRYLDHRQLGSPGPDSADALLALDARLLLALSWQGELALRDGQPALPADGTDALLLELGPGLAPRAELVFGGSGVQKISALADAGRAVLVLGLYEQELRVAGRGAALQPAGKSDLYLARVGLGE